ncbi:DUF1240 domain-containing protein [Pseudoalteromonas sp. L21]|uniref:DUF1240 domain-containing protein n=1 Tax=Pseudoalteromonas sp. L21 TaxID=1539746 RepID=UPI001F1AAB48|nr:DUF1240 domain-containing protein [Pseudoalteromonas sp. L21]MCF7519427.1 DUF1240 domain-containing protein [Pseudoalteromonas sp. L21]
MPFLKWEKSGEKFSALEVKAKFLIFITIVFLSFIAVLITYASYKGFNEHVFFDKDHYYISEVGLQAPGFFILPLPLFMIIAGVQKIFNYKNEKTFLLMIKSTLAGIVLYFISSIVLSFYIEANLKNHGYTYCSWYKFSPTRSPDVWLKNSELCLKVHHYVVLDVEEWFEWHNEQGIEPQLDELKAFIAKTNKEQGR